MRSFGAVAAGLAVSAISTVDVSPATGMSRPDPRAERLERFFEHYNCPLPYHVDDYLRAADNYRIDYRLLPAISVRETTCGMWEQQNNRWGYHSGHQSFHSVEEGIYFLAYRLANGYFYRGKSLEEKLLTYNPRQSYPEEIRRIMRQVQ